MAEHSGVMLGRMRSIPGWHKLRLRQGAVLALAPEVAAGDFLPMIARTLGRPPRRPAGVTLQGARNVVSRQESAAGSLVFKDFGLRPFQRLAYSLRSSKAVRAVLAAQALARAGIATPAPLAVCEQRHGGVLVRALLVCAHADGTRTLRQLMAEKPAHALEGAVAAAGAMARSMHRAGLFHADLNSANILVDEDRSTRLWLIDINRLRYRRTVDGDLRWQNLGRMGIGPAMHNALLRGYFDGEDDSAAELALPRVAHWYDHFERRAARKERRKRKRKRR